MIVSFATVTLSLRRPELVNDHGAVVPDYSALGPTQPREGWVEQPAGTAQDLAGRLLTSSDRLLLGPKDADVRRFDVLLVPGLAGQWRVRDEPQVWPSPTGALAHLAVVVERHTDGV